MGYNNLKNTFFLYDVDGKIAELVPDGGMLQIREPEMQDVKIYLKRDEDNHGVVYEFSDEETPFGFNRTGGFDKTKINPYDMLKILYALDGYDAKCQIIIKTQDIYSQETVKTIYTGNLDFETYKEIDVRINLSSRRIDFDDLFRTRYDTPINYAATESIDGESITGLTPETMEMHGQQIVQQGSFTPNTVPFGGFSSMTVQKFSSGTTIENSNVWFKRDIDDITFSNGDRSMIEVSQYREANGYNLDLSAMDADGRYQDPFGITGTPFFIIPGEYLLNVEPFSYTYSVDVRIKGSVILELADPTLANFNIQATYGTSDGSSASSKDIVNLSYPDIGDFDTVQFDETISFSLPKNIDESSGEKQRYVRIRVFWTGYNNQAGLLSMNIDDESYFNLNINSLQEGSKANVYQVNNSVNHILECATNTQGTLESDFLSNTAERIYETNGYQIRNIDGSDKKPINSFKQVFEKWLQPQFGLGWMTYYNNDDNEFKLLVEKYEHFYQDLEIYQIQESQLVDGTFEISNDSDIVKNKVKIGYKEYPKSTDENTNENLLEFNTEHTYDNPVKNIEKEVKYISEHIGAGKKIENQRREQFKEKPSETVTDDDKSFVLATIKDQNFGVYTDTIFDSTENQIIFSYTKYPIKIGDTIQIADTASNNGFYDVIDIQYKAYNYGTLDFRMSLVVSISGGSLTDETTDDFDFGLQEERLYAQTDEGFSNIQGVPDRFTTYNTVLNPRYMLFNQAPIINSGLAKKASTSEIKPQEVKLNGELDCTLDGSIPINDFIRGAYDVNVKMDQSFPLSEYNNNEKLFSGSIIKFQANISYDDVLLIRDRSTNQGDENNLGYISVNYRGNLYKGFLIMMGYTLGNGATEFELREKYTPAGGAFDYVLDTPMS